MQLLPLVRPIGVIGEVEVFWTEEVIAGKDSTNLQGHRRKPNSYPADFSLREK